MFHWCLFEINLLHILLTERSQYSDIQFIYHPFELTFSVSVQKCAEIDAGKRYSGAGLEMRVLAEAYGDMMREDPNEACVRPKFLENGDKLRPRGNPQRICPHRRSIAQKVSTKTSGISGSSTKMNEN